ncbi:amidohydrolase [Putridiphycobacter roseus]|uniref:Amidohydrolase n=1 Tax=Putridiphycobacter roseus TaxID=2219161 RepID=A0A2W1NQ20_9FLAO|nr:amidohydrolase [Putridiphycobacter roseus]PZE16718.1 amidohydrolase [Putridiphycobacter roseus]
MKNYKLTVLFVLPLLLLGCYQPDKADMIIHNAKIYTCDESFSIQQAIAIKDGKILQVGPNREILNGYDCSNIIDGALRPIYPGFYDAHCHFWGYANTLREVDLNGTKSFNEVISRIIAFQKSNPTAWITGRGWDQNLWDDKSFPTNDSLNKRFPNTPLLIRRVDGHAALANQKALELAKIDANTQVEGGEILMENQKLTGLLIDNAVTLVVDKIPTVNATEKLKYLQIAQTKLFEQGLTSINDAGVTAAERIQFIQWYQNGDLKIKDYMMLFPTPENLEYALKHGSYDSLGLHINSFKLIADGALGSRGACLLNPYSDKHNHFGSLLKNEESMSKIAEIAKNINFQLNTHCIGDSANRTLLKIYQQTIGQELDHRWKIEHAQIIDSVDMAFFQYLGVIPSVQPTHYTSDKDWIETRLGKDRLKGAYAYNTLFNQAGLIVLGTDFPIENISVLETFYAAVTRRKKDEPVNINEPKDKECLSRRAALMGITYWPAFSNFEEDKKGSLATGKDADFVILTKDIMEVPEDEILKTFIFQTYLNGEVVYNAE